MTTHGRGGVRWAALGSVAEDVIGRTDRPILLVGRNCRPDSLDRSRLLVCADGSDECPERLAPAAREWAQMLGLDVHVGRVTHPLDVDSAERSDVLLDALRAVRRQRTVERSFAVVSWRVHSRTLPTIFRQPLRQRTPTLGVA